LPLSKHNRCDHHLKPNHRFICKPNNPNRPTTFHIGDKYIPI